MLICITGKSGSGKNYIADFIMKLNPDCIHIDIDKLAHQAIEVPAIKDQLIEMFGTFNRKEIGDIVFNNRDKMKELVKLTWLPINDIIKDCISSGKDVILNHILIHETDYWDKANIKILVERPRLERLLSVMNRDCITEEKFNLRDSNSPNYFGVKLDYIVTNNTSSLEWQKV